MNCSIAAVGAKNTSNNNYQYQGMGTNMEVQSLTIKLSGVERYPADFF